MKKGFTLIELLAVIVVLAVIAIIAVPIILNVIEKANKGAFEDTAYGIIDAGEIFYANNVVELGKVSDRYDFEIQSGSFVYTTDTSKSLSFKGKMPKTGMLQINSNGKVAIAICNDDYCACKSNSELKVTIKDENCNINSESGEIENTIVISSKDIVKINDNIELLQNKITTLEKQKVIPGTVISYMGKKVPEGYLSCDGKTYNITAYQALADQIKNEFGSYNYFGGDGTTTFAVPDLRGEFLRGTGNNSHTNQGSGTTVGKHQDGTLANYLFFAGTGIQVRSLLNDDTKWNGVENIDFNYKATTKMYSNTFTGVTDSSTNPVDYSIGYTSRPTNTSVLYCIKY